MRLRLAVPCAVLLLWTGSVRHSRAQTNLARTTAPSGAPLVDASRRIERVWLDWFLAGINRGIHVVQDVWANRGKYNAAGYPSGSLLVITDHPGLQFAARGGEWHYQGGTFRQTLANKPALGVHDAGLLYAVTDYHHVLRWDGAAWGWAPGDDGSGYYRLAETAPGTNGWQVCDGSTVAVLQADGTTANVTVPNLGVAAYIKAATSAAAVAAASGTVSNTDLTHSHAVDDHATGGPSSVSEVQSGSGAVAAGAGHGHNVTGVMTGSALGAHTHSANTLELRHKQTACYFRR